MAAKRLSPEERERVRQRAAERLSEMGVSEEDIAKGEDPDAYIDLDQNNEGELAIALRNIANAMEQRGWSYERAVHHFGIRGHPYFRDFWPSTDWWGDVRWARQRHGLPVDHTDAT